ncbi:lipocalin family protein [Roseivirga sp. E12]|uniref:lipocalin family protein n=1 Tax=Roseivirga sp. E12 TaxID=2819237 RepID=UPI001ABBE797|nr:lipocalin family protein [Roseivirga sp. E12]MBO3698815.1 lipocalin family protein [Roseivirga sp. E12]
MEFIKRNFLICLAFTLLIACDKRKDGDAQDPFTFSEAEILQVHNGDQKEWRLTEFYESYRDKLKSDLEPCVIDDVYTFSANDRVATVVYGENSCYWDDPSIQFGGATYTYYPESGEMFLDFSIAEQKESLSSVVIWVMRLIELSPNRMVFANGTSENRGRAVVFETN